MLIVSVLCTVLMCGVMLCLLAVHPACFRIIDAVEVMQDLEYTVEETNSLIGRAAYFGLCLDFILQTGDN